MPLMGRAGGPSTWGAFTGCRSSCRRIPYFVCGQWGLALVGSRVCALRLSAHSGHVYSRCAFPRRLLFTRHLVFVTTCLFFPLSSLPATVPLFLSGRVPFAVLWACAFCPFLGVCPPLPPFSSPWRMSPSVPLVLPSPPGPTCPRCHTMSRPLQYPLGASQRTLPLIPPSLPHPPPPKKPRTPPTRTTRIPSFWTFSRRW